MIAQKKYLNLIAILVALITGVLFLPSLSHAAVTFEGEVDFGEVVVGTTSSATFYISSSSRDTLVDVTLESDCGFSITSVVPKGIFIPGDPKEIHIDYVPSSIGLCRGILSIFTTDFHGQSNEVEIILNGTGIKAEITIGGILEFFGTCVADGTLIGYVPDKSDKKRSADKITKGNESDKTAENRLNAFRNMIDTAGDLIDSGKIDEACGQLKAAYKKIKIDGSNTPESSSFFVKGTKAKELADKIQDLMDIECK
jgi:hypothetical protein